MRVLVAICLVVSLTAPTAAQTAQQVDAEIARLHQAERLMAARSRERAMRDWYAFTPAPARPMRRVWSGSIRTPYGTSSWRRTQW